MHLIGFITRVSPHILVSGRLFVHIFDMLNYNKIKITEDAEGRRHDPALGVIPTFSVRKRVKLCRQAVKLDRPLNETMQLELANKSQ